MSAINPADWREVAEQRRPKLPHTTDWFDGTTRPVRTGFYERHFTDSMLDLDDASMQWWDGEVWLIYPNGAPHWRQVGDYPAWRGLIVPADAATNQSPKFSGDYRKIEQDQNNERT